jgi:hypothetical protein
LFWALEALPRAHLPSSIALYGIDQRKGSRSMRSRHILAGLVAVIAFAFAASTASARNLSISHGNLWRAVWAPLRFKNGNTVLAECDVTLEGSFHAVTMPKVLNSLVGHVTFAAVNHCVRGGATVLTENLPWHVQYGGFEGTLPALTGVRIRLVGARFRIREPVFGIECLATTTSENPAIGIARLEAGSENRNVTGLTAEPNARIPCSFIQGSFEGTATVTEPATGQRLLVRLI